MAGVKVPFLHYYSFFVKDLQSAATILYADFHFCGLGNMQNQVEDQKLFDSQKHIQTNANNHDS